LPGLIAHSSHTTRTGPGRLDLPGGSSSKLCREGCWTPRNIGAMCSPCSQRHGLHTGIRGRRRRAAFLETQEFLGPRVGACGGDELKYYSRDISDYMKGMHFDNTCRIVRNILCTFNVAHLTSAPSFPARNPSPLALSLKVVPRWSHRQAPPAP
jgi:hypothetical protein